MYSDPPWIEIEIEINKLQEICEREATNKLKLFDWIYRSRFNRLWEQWRLSGDTSWTWRESNDPPISY